jgi:autoinducer 2-degrading protein
LTSLLCSSSAPLRDYRAADATLRDDLGETSTTLEDGMIVLTAKYFAKTGNGDQVEGLLRRMAPLVSANEPGCKLYHANRSGENPDIFLLYEHYADQAALEAHRNTPHFKEIIEGLIVPLLEKRERELYHSVIA